MIPHEIMGFFAHVQTVVTRPLFPPTLGLGTRLAKALLNEAYTVVKRWCEKKNLPQKKLPLADIWRPVSR